MQAALERAMADLTLGSGFNTDDTGAFEAWLVRHRLSPEDSAYLRERGPERLLTYRRLVRGNLREALEVTMPRAVARLGSVFDEYFAHFLAERGPRTHYLRDVTPEFLEFCAPLWAVDRRVPAYLFELADHEVLQVDMASMRARPKDHVPQELELESGVEFIDACRIVYYEHAVHELSEAESDLTPPAVAPTWLFVYRSPEHEVRYLKLTVLAAAILTRLLNLKETLRQAVTIACADNNTALSEEVLTGTAQLLSDLAERGALFGRLGETGASTPDPATRDAAGS